MYYPKSQIQPNLYTNGGEFILSTTKENYKGNYYKVSSGKSYSGKNPTDKPNILLSPQEDKSTYDPTNVLDLSNFDNIISYYGATSNIYDLTKNIDTNQVRLIPSFNLTLPTDQDKQNGQFNRYFCKKTNELKYLEIDKETYNQLQSKDLKIAWDLYEPTSLLWVIKGNPKTVFNTNKTSVFKIEQNQKWYGFSQYFKENYSKYLPSPDTELATKNNYLKYYQPKDINNLYTSGGEFTTKNGQNYIGFYHIHKGTIPMAGKTHTQYYHETLYPTQLSLNKNSKFSEILASIALVEALLTDNPSNPVNPTDPTNPTDSNNPGDTGNTGNPPNLGDPYDPGDPDKIPSEDPFPPG
jgi:hypothetical protein